MAQQLVGPHFVRGCCYSPYLEAKGVEPTTLPGFIPVLNFPAPGPRVFEPPRSYHIDGMHATTLWPKRFFLVVFAYLTDTADYGGATAVRPGSHRQVFEHWLREGHPGSTVPPELDFAAPVPVAGAAASPPSGSTTSSPPSRSCGNAVSASNATSRAATRDSGPPTSSTARGT